MAPTLPSERRTPADWALVNDVCDRFEAVLRKGIHPSVSDGLAAVPEYLRGDLAKELADLSAQFPLQSADEANLQIEDGENPPRGSLFSRFDLKDYVGCGGFGFVFLAVDKKNGRTVALKIARSEIAADFSLRALFLREVKTARNLEHPNLATVLDACEFTDAACIVSEYEPGLNLKQKIRDASQPLDCRWAAWVIWNLAHGIQAAHEAGVIHCDLNPGNIIFGGPDGSIPKVLDFGIAKVLGEPSELSRTGELFGTPGFIAPEQATGRRATVDGRTDVYGLGAVLYACLTGSPPFQAENAIEILTQVLRDDVLQPGHRRRGIPPDLEAICLRCLQKIPHKRYPSVAALREDLRRFLDGRPTLTRPPGKLAHAIQWTRRHPAWASSAVAATAFLVVGLGSLIWHNAALYLLNKDITESNGKLDKANSDLQNQRDRANSRARRERLGAYAAGIRQAAVLLERSSLPDFWKQMDRWIPSNDEEDIRGWEWHYLRKQAEPEKAKAIWSIIGSVNAIDCCPKGKIFAEGGSDKTVRLIDICSGKEIGAPLVHPGEVVQVQFSPNGDSLATACVDGVLRVWSIGGGSPLELRGHQGAVLAIAYSPDGHFLATGGSDKTIRIWNLNDNACAGRVIAKVEFEAATIAWMKNSKSLVVGIKVGGTIEQYDVENGRMLNHKEIFGVVSKVIVCSSKILISVFENGAVQVWDLSGDVSAEWRPLGSIRGNADRINNAAISADGKWLGLAREGRSEIWQVDSLEKWATFIVKHKRELGLCFSPDGSLLVTGGSDGGVRLWKNERQNKIKGMKRYPIPDAICRFENAGDSRFRAGSDQGRFINIPWKDNDKRSFSGSLEKERIFWSLDNRAFIYGESGSIKLRVNDSGDLQYVNSGPALSRLPWPFHESLKLSPAGTWVACHSEKEIHIIGLEDRMENRTINCSSKVYHIACSSKYVAASISDENRVLVWERLTGTQIWEFPCSGRAQLLTFSPDSQSLAIGFPGFIRNMSLLNGSEIARTDNHGWEFNAIVFSPNGRTMGSAGWDGVVRLHQSETGENLLEFNESQGPVRALAFSPDGVCLVGATSTGYGNLTSTISVRDTTPDD